MTPVIQTRSLSKSYGAARGIADVDLVVDAGEIFGFIGPNGAGKTTTIRLLLDLIRPTSGSASIFGLDVHESSVKIHERIGYLPGDLKLFDRLTGDELFTWLGRLRGRHDPRRVAELEERLDLDGSRRISELSSGNRQKVGLVQAFMHKPDLLILDEPTSGLDPLVQRGFHELISEVSKDGVAVFLSSHVLAEIEDVCDRVGTIVGGHLLRVDTVAELKALSRRHVRIIFVGPVDIDDLSRLDGVEDIRIEASATDGDTTVTMEVVGQLDEIVKFSARHHVRDLVSAPLSLEDVFLETYNITEDPAPEDPDVY